MITVASYNIHSSIGRDRRCDPGRILDVVNTIGAAIVGIQEVDARRRQKQPFDQFEYFCRHSGMQCIAGPNILERRGHYGNALLTSLPVEHKQLLRLPSANREPRGAIVAILRLGRHRLQVFNTHFGLRHAERRRQASALLDAAAAHDGPTLYLGDFNIWRRRSLILNDLGAPTEREFTPPTFPSRRPVVPLDRVWTRPGNLLHSVRVLHNSVTRVASDHLPVVADLALPE